MSPRWGFAHWARCHVVNGTFRSYANLLTKIRSPSRIVGSMKPTILEGDRIFVNKLAYDLKVPFTTWHLAQWANPQRGDIVVFYSPHDETRLVKRVVGLPGDSIESPGRPTTRFTRRV